MFSYIYPLSLRRRPGAVNPDLELLLYRGRLQLATPDALYSDGDHYTPALAALGYFKDILPAVKTVLVLGSGLGSTLHIIRQRRFNTTNTLVDIDEVVLGWAMEFMEADVAANTTPVCADALVFMQQNKTKYDFIFIDIFNNRTVPDFVCSTEFLSLCAAAMAPGGHIGFNYIVNDPEQWIEVQQNFKSVFRKQYIIEDGVNKIFVS